MVRTPAALMLGGALLLSLSSCRGTGRSALANPNTLLVDGSSTVYPIVSAIADDFAKTQPTIAAIVNKSGTGSGFQKFARGEIDIAAASRPIQASEVASLKRMGLAYIEVPFAYDGVSVIVSRQNDWAFSLTLEELRDAWQTGSKVDRWSDVDEEWPTQKMSFYGPTDNHGTYDYFSDALSPSNNALRADVQTNQEYNAIVEAVADDKYGIGYVGLSYYADNRDKVRALAIDAGKGPIQPSQGSVASGAYGALSRPLFLYVNKRAYDSKQVVREFVAYTLSQRGASDIQDAHYVPLPESALIAVRRHVQGEGTGSLFVGDSPAISVAQITRRELLQR